MFPVKKLVPITNGVVDNTLTRSNLLFIGTCRFIGRLLWLRTYRRPAKAVWRILPLSTVPAILVFSTLCLGQTNAADKRFLGSICQTSLAEAELAKLAQNKSSNPSVQSFAKKMLQDH